MNYDFKAGMIRAAEIASALSRKKFAEAESMKKDLERIIAKSSATGMGEAAIEILAACETPAQISEISS